MTTHQQLRYRTLSQLIDTCSVDLRNVYTDGVIETAELIKVAQRCNYELGLQINQTKETVLDIEHHRSKLPADFQFLNFAMICHKQEVHTSGLFPGGLVTQETLLEPWYSVTKNLTSCPCWTIDVTTGSAALQVIDCYGAKTVQTFTSGTTKVCANQVTWAGATGTNATFTTSTFCYNDPENPGYTCTPIIDNQCQTPNVYCGSQPDPDPWKQNRIRTQCDGQQIVIEEVKGGQQLIRRYERFEELYMQPSRTASAFSSYDRFKLKGNIAFLRNNYLETGRECCHVYINYQGLLEDDDGNLLVLDHPMINHYYEWEVKRRILQNLYLNGDPDLERRLQYADKQAWTAKQEAIDIAYMPDFQLLKQTFERERQIANQKYILPFSRFAGGYPISAWLDSLVNQRFRE